MYRIAICDDDEVFLSQLNQNTKDILCEYGLTYGHDFEINCFSCAKHLQDNVLEKQDFYDLILLDIEISDENGITIAKSFREQNMASRLIYITSYRDYVFDCFDTQPLYYLLKPLDYEKFKDILLLDYRRNYMSSHLVIKINGRQVSIPYSDIYALEATSHRTRIWLKDKIRDWNGPLSSLKDQLPTSEFCQSHNSYILNLAHIQEIQKAEVIMDNDKKFPVSRRYYNEIFEKYLSFLRI